MHVLALRLRRLAFTLAAAFLAAAALTATSASAKSSSAVTAWNTFASNLVAANLAPGPQTHALAVAQIAVHDALNAIDPRYEPYEFVGSAPRASSAAAVAAAAHDTLVELVPQAAASVDAEYDAALSSVPDGAGKAAGIATGQAAAAAILARRSSDDLLAATDEWRAARTLAVLNVSLADVVIANFDAKFHYNYWRPITAIRAGDHDGNRATDGDSGWEPLCVTPPFPEYPSTHAATGAAAASVLARELGDRHTFTITNPHGASRTYKRFSAAAYEEGISRIYCGIHFRTAMNIGFLTGGLIAHYADKTVMRAP